MTKHSLTITPTEIIEARDVSRKYIFSAGLWNGCVAAYLRLSDVGDADIIISKDSSMMIPLSLPPQARVYAWTNTGTVELCEMKVVQ